MTILVTGAAGFIGFHVASELLKSGEKVVLVDNFNSYYPTSLKELRESILQKEYGQEIIRLDLAIRDDVSKLLSTNSFQAVIHLAAQAGIRIPLSESSAYVHSNLVGFSNLASIAAVREIPEVIYASSSSVYGNSTPAPYRESHYPLKPLSFYGATKLSNEILAETIAKNSQTKFTGLRFFTAYGPLGRPDMAYFRIATALIHNQTFKLYGDGSVKRDFTYIEDIVEALMRIKSFRSQENEFEHEIYNIGGGAPYSMLDLIEKFQAISNLKLSLEIREKVAADVEKTIADTTKLKKDTGFTPRISLDKGISHFVEWGLQPAIKNQLPYWISN
jgi:UDP-glucuronate 4-epimerase